MKKEVIIPIFLCLILILSVVPVSAGWLSDFWGKITGKPVAIEDAKEVNGENGITYYTLSIYKNGSGIVKSSDGKINCGITCSTSYSSGTSVTLTSQPNSNYSFSRWYGCDKNIATAYAITDGSDNCVVTMNSNKAVTALFTKIQPTCFDSDGGKNYYVKGVLNNGLEDYCMSDLITVVEYYCDSDVTAGFSREFYNCPNNCFDGACIKLNVSMSLKLNKKTYALGEYIKLT